MAGAGFGLKLTDLARGSDHHAAFRSWWAYGRGAYMGLDQEGPPERVTMYYDPLREVHHRNPVSGAMGSAFYLAAQTPEDARRLFDAAVARSGLDKAEEPSLRHPRAGASTWFLAKEWGLTEFAERLGAAVERAYQPTWDVEQGEFYWSCGLDEEHPRGQYNALLAAAEAVSPGAWGRLTSERLPDGEGRVEGVDFPRVALREARWHGGVLRLQLAAQHERLQGESTTLRVTGLAEPEAWTVDGPAGTASRVEQGALVVTTPVVEEGLSVRRSG